MVSLFSISSSVGRFFRFSPKTWARKKKKIWKTQMKTIASKKKETHTSNTQTKLYANVDLFRLLFLSSPFSSHIHTRTHHNPYTKRSDLRLYLMRLLLIIFFLSFFSFFTFCLVSYTAQTAFTVSFRICWLALKIRCQMSFYRILHIWYGCMRVCDLLEVLCMHVSCSVAFHKS